MRYYQYQIYLCCFISCLFLLACKKADVTLLPSDSPVFYFEGIIGQENKSLIAGVENTYMHTSYWQDTKNIYNLSGTFASANCDTCEESLSFVFRDALATQTASLSTTLDQLFFDKTFTRYSLDTTELVINKEVFEFFPSTTDPITSLQWSFEPGQQSNKVNPQYYFSTSGVKNIKLKIVQNGSVDSAILPIDVSSGSTCRTQFYYTKGSQNNVVFRANNSSFANYQWDFGDGQFGDGQNVSHTYASPGIYTIKMTASLGGCESIFMQKINTMTTPWVNPSFYYTTHSEKIIERNQRLNTNTCIITYRNNGKTYISYKNIPTLDQHRENVITTREFELYNVNKQGQQTVKLKAELDTYLYNISNPIDSVRIKSNRLMLAVAYPN